MDVAEIAAANPVATALLSAAILWWVGNYLLKASGGVKVGGGVSRDEAMRAARERQQAALSSAAKPCPKPCCTPSTTTPEADSPPAEMPARMKAALERKQREEAAARRAQPPADVEAQPAPAPAHNSTNKQPKETTAEKLARIQRGKGPSDHNPLHGHGSSSSAGSVINRKKGGG